MIRRPATIAIIAAFGLGASLGAGFAALAQDSTDYGSNAGDYHASGAGSDGNVVMGGNRRAPETSAPPPTSGGSSTSTSTNSGGIAPTATAAAGGGSTGGGIVIPPNPALTGERQPDAVPVTIVEETTSGESVLGPTPTPAPAAAEGDEAVTAEDSGNSDSGGDGAGDTAAAADDGGRRNGDASASAADGSTTGGGASTGSVNEVIPATTNTGATAPGQPASSGGGAASGAGGGNSGSGRSSRGACGYPTWLDAQTALETQWSVELADELDPDRDGIACEEAMR